MQSPTASTSWLQQKDVNPLTLDVQLRLPSARLCGRSCHQCCSTGSIHCSCPVLQHRVVSTVHAYLCCYPEWT